MSFHAVVAAAAAAVCLLGAAACGGGVEPSTGPIKLRVGAPTGLSPFVPSATVSGATAYALDLVFSPLGRYVDETVREGVTVSMRARTDSKLRASELAASIRFQGLVSARAVDDRAIQAVFEKQDQAAAFATGEVWPFDLGPYEVVSDTPVRALLRSRGDATVELLEIVAVDPGTQWRRLLGHEIDVMPSAPSLYRRQFEGMKSIRVMPLPPGVQAGLVFNLHDPLLRDVRVRAAIQSAVDPEAVARVACGSAGCAATRDAVARDTSATPLDLDLGLDVLAEHESLVLAAMVLRHQLRRIGVRLSIHRVSLEEITRRGSAGEFQLLLGPIPIAEGDLVERFTSAASSAGQNWSGYANAAFDAAVEEGDVLKANELLRRDVPVVPLYELRVFAAVDARFCGGNPTSETSWLWLADLYPCAKGERP